MPDLSNFKLSCCFFSASLMTLIAGCGNSKPVVIEQPTYFNTKEAVVFELDEEHKNITKDTSCSVEPVVYESDLSELGYIKAPKNEKGEFVVSKGVYKTGFNFTCKERKEVESVTIYVERTSSLLKDGNDLQKEIHDIFFTKYWIIFARKDEKNREALFTDSLMQLEKAYDYPIHACQYRSYQNIKGIYKHQAFVRFTDQTTDVSAYSVHFDIADFCSPLFRYTKHPDAIIYSNSV